MTQPIEQLESQIAELQKTLDELRNSKLEITRQFTGQYFSPYQGRQYRRMESEGIPIWEYFMGEWIKVDSPQSEDLETQYQTECAPQKRTPRRK
jgi:hypothetical protein